MSKQQAVSWKILLLIAFIAATTGYTIYSLKQTTDLTSLPPINSEASIIGTERASFTLPDLHDKPRHITEWDGNVILINFWATWCPPCRREMPGFIEVREQYAAQRFEIIGIAIDNVEPVREFAANLGLNYSILHGQSDASIVAGHYGNAKGMLPYSVIIDRQGKIRVSRTRHIRTDSSPSLISISATPESSINSISFLILRMSIINNL